MNERKVAIQAMRKIVHRPKHTAFDEGLTEQDKIALENEGLVEWQIGTGIGGQPEPYLMLSKAGMIAHEFALSEKRWKRKFELASNRATQMVAGYKEIVQHLRSKVVN